MKIAQVAPLFESVPPRLYGGTERIVHYLTEELVHQGHDVTLFASGDSATKGRLVAPCKRALRLDPDCIDYMPHHFLMLEQVFQNVAAFDLIHFHIDYLHYSLSRRHAISHVTTLHGRLDIPDLVPLYREFQDIPLISISTSQREPLSGANWRGTVYHGLPTELYDLKKDPGDYLAFLGRISPEKRVDRAIEIATQANIKLKIAAKVDPIDREYMRTTIEPLLDHPLVEWIGEIGESEKGDFLGGAYAMLFPIDWCEPFGLVMIEAMACGTPVVAYRRGSVPEVVDEGVTGFIVEDIDGAVRALEKIPSFDRVRCRETFEMRFSASRMAKDYVRIYERLTSKKGPSNDSRKCSQPVPMSAPAAAGGLPTLTFR